MDWDEARTRIGQEISKRLDSALYRSGLGPYEPPLQPQSAAHPTFFFGGDIDEAAHRAALVREHLPGEAESIIREADSICRHEFRLLGYEKISYGANIDWHADPVHGKHSRPLDPWFKIPFLDFQEVGDHKIIWELNRHQHLVTLAKAWRLTGNPVYPNELTRQWYSWRKENPYPLGINWASALEVAFRSLSWLWVRNLLAGCPDLTAAFQTDLLLALQSHGRYIERYLSTYFSPNTHLLGEAVALFFIGTVCPEISAAERWRNLGWRIILQASERQVRPDGVYFEQALYYHVYALDFFLHARHLASESGVAVPEQFDNTMKRMLEVVQALSEAGPPEGFGDDDGGRVFNPRRNQAECMSDPLALGSILYDSEEYAAARLTEEAIWLFGARAIQVLEKPRPEGSAASKAFESGGIYVMNDYQTSPQQFVIDAGPQGTGRAGHGHADALSIRFGVGGRRFLVDSGAYSYICEGQERDRFRGTGAHNTLRVDRLDQAIADGCFAWSSIPNTTNEEWLNGQTFDLFVGSHDGYSRLPDPVLHRRSVFHLKGGFWLVRDVAEGQGHHLLETFWHFAPELKVREEQGMFLAGFPATDEAMEHACLALLMEPTSVWTAELDECFVSRAYGSKQVAPLVRASANVSLPNSCAALLLPNMQVSDIGTFAAIGESLAQGVRGYQYQTIHSTEFVFFAQGSTPWTCGLWASDASLLYCKLECGRLAHVIMVSGSFAEWRGKRFVSLPSPAESFECLGRSGAREFFSSDGKVAESSVVDDFEILDSVP
jgi:Heparinase II/III-like protein/Heparinase II/III N-terminus